MENELETNKPQRKAVSAVTLDPSIQERIQVIAAEKEWSLAKTGGWLIRLGLQKLDAESNRDQAVAA